MKNWDNFNGTKAAKNIKVAVGTLKNVFGIGDTGKGFGGKLMKLVGNEELIGKIDPSVYVEGEFGLPTINDILKELAKPGRDPRQSAQEFSFADDIREIDDLKPGMELPGIVTNVTAFGAFVDIGIHENGLIHISKMRGRKVKLHEKVNVSVLDVDLDRKRISLRLLDSK